MSKLKFAIMAVLAVTVAVSVIACSSAPPSAGDVVRDQQETQLREGVQQVSIPAIVNWRELRLAKELYELRDRSDLQTYTYIFSEYLGKYRAVCNSIGFPLPYAAQFSAPESMQRYTLSGRDGLDTNSEGNRYWGTEKLPQSEPNGLHIPTSAEATWVMCVNPNTGKLDPSYQEVRLNVYLWELPAE